MYVAIGVTVGSLFVLLRLQGKMNALNLQSMKAQNEINKAVQEIVMAHEDRIKQLEESN
jgi:hypothetical protein